LKVSGTVVIAFRTPSFCNGSNQDSPESALAWRQQLHTLVDRIADSCESFDGRLDSELGLTRDGFSP
jgi:hypothetical protein